MLGPTTLTAVWGGDYFIARLDSARTVGLAQEFPSSAFSMYPNPVAADEAIQLNWTVPLPPAATITISDAFGRLVRTARHSTTNSQSTHMVLGGLPAGLYLLQVAAGQQRSSQKLVVSP